MSSLQTVIGSLKRELLVAQRPAGDGFEDVMIEELRNMRESFEAKLAAAAAGAKDRQAAHRREIRCAPLRRPAPRAASHRLRAARSAPLSRAALRSPRASPLAAQGASRGARKGAVLDGVAHRVPHRQAAVMRSRWDH